MWLEVISVALHIDLIYVPVYVNGSCGILSLK